MKIKDFIKLNAEIDMYDDVCEELAICFCGPQGLTEEGKAHFMEALNLDIDLDMFGKTATVHVDDEFFEDLWEFNLEKAKEFFYAAAGYCSDEDYKKWFRDPEWWNGLDHDLMYMTIYCDTAWYTQDDCWYTEEEINLENLCEMQFPRKLVQEYYISMGGTIDSFVEWAQDEYTADDTDELFGFCMDRGFIAVREDF